ncbi:MAG: tail fiber domain-containing protein [Candidatus Zixiibacteriota bacterium]
MRKTLLVLLIIYSIYAIETTSVPVAYDSDSEDNIQSLSFKLFNSDKEILWSEEYEGDVFEYEEEEEIQPGKKIAIPDFEERLSFAIFLDGELYQEFNDLSSLDDIPVIRLFRSSDSTPDDPMEPSEPMDDMAIGLTIHGGENTEFEGGIILGTADGTDPVGILDVRSDETRFWDGSASVGFASSSGDVFIEDVLEVDGIIYGANWRDASGNDLINGSTGISVSENTNGQWTITNTQPDQTVSIAGGSGISVSGSYPSFTISNTSSTDGTVTSIGTSSPITGGTITTSGTIGLQQDGDVISGTGISITGGTNMIPGADSDDIQITNTAPDQTVTIGSGTGISVTGSYPNFTVDNTDPDQTVSIAGGTDIDVTGSYPNFTVDYAGSASGDDDWTISGSNIYRNTGNVGIGTTSPSAKLHVEGDLGENDTMATIRMQPTEYTGNTGLAIISQEKNIRGSIRTIAAQCSLGSDYAADGTARFIGAYGSQYTGHGSLWGSFSKVKCNELDGWSSSSYNSRAIGAWGIAEATTPLIFDDTQNEFCFIGVRGEIVGDIDNSSTAPDTSIVAAIWGIDRTIGSGDHYAGYFDGDVNIDGDLTVSGSMPSSDDGDWQTGSGTVYNTSDNVGIGTSSPGALFHVSGQTAIIGQSNTVDSPTSWGANIAIGSSSEITSGRGNNSIGHANSIDGSWGQILGIRSHIEDGISGGHIFGMDNKVSAEDAWAIGRGIVNSTANSVQIGYSDTESPTDPGVLIVRDFSGTQRVGINTISPDYRLEVNGTFQADNVRSGTFDLPTSDGTTSQYLRGDGSWSTISAGVSGSGSDNYLARWDGTSAIQNSGVYVDDDGNVGIGTTSPGYPLQVIGSTSGSGWERSAHVGVDWSYESAQAFALSVHSHKSSSSSSGRSVGLYATAGNATSRYNTAVIAQIKDTNSGAAIQAGYEDDWNSTAMNYVDPAGQWGIVSYSDVYFHEDLTVMGTASKPGGGSWTTTSDERLKKDIKPYQEGLDGVLKIDPVWYTYNGEANMPQETFVGVIAQDLQEIAPYMVGNWTYQDENGNKTDYLNVDNSAMTYMLINATKKQQEIIENQKSMLKEQRKINEKQTELIEQLMERVESLENK